MDGYARIIKNIIKSNLTWRKYFVYFFINTSIEMHFFKKNYIKKYN